MSFLNEFASFFFPNRCPLCSKVQIDNTPCDKCLENLKDCIILDNLCFKCGKEERSCSCKGFVPLYTGVVAAFKNTGVAKNGLYGMKFNSKFYSADYFAERMVYVFRLYLPDVKPDVVCIVPSTVRELRNKSCDQVDLLASKVAKTLGFKYEPKLIKKIKETERQHNLPLSQRASNIKGVFSVVENLNSRTVLLIDDIKTSGHTLSECAKQLRLNGAKDVYCLTALVSTNRSCKDEKK